MNFNFKFLKPTHAHGLIEKKEKRDGV